MSVLHTSVRAAALAVALVASTTGQCAIGTELPQQADPRGGAVLGRRPAPTSLRASVRRNLSMLSS